MHMIQYTNASVMDPHRGAIPCRYMTPGSLWASATGHQGPFDVGNIQGPKISETFIQCSTSSMDPPAPQSQRVDGWLYSLRMNECEQHEGVSVGPHLNTLNTVAVDGESEYGSVHKNK